MVQNKQSVFFISDIKKSVFQPGIAGFREARESVFNFRPGESSSTLFSRGKRTACFFTEDSKLYITPREQMMIESGLSPNRLTEGFDSLSSRVLKNYRLCRPSSRDILYQLFNKYYRAIQKEIVGRSKLAFGRWPLVRLWNLSIIGAIILGMFSMTMIYRFLGPGALARRAAEEQKQPMEIVSESPATPQALGVSTEKEDSEKSEDASRYIEELIGDLETKEKKELEEEIISMVKGYPIEKMVPYIIEKDRIVAAFLIGIAKKESDWGRHVPVLQGQDCYNYWGYRGQRRLMGTAGHTCFNSRKDAVDTVAGRIEWLIKNKKLNTPGKMVIWKCGSDCNATGGQAAARKWISDVNMYFEKLND